MKKQPMHDWADEVRFAVYQMNRLMDNLEGNTFNVVRTYKEFEQYVKKLEEVENEIRERAEKEEGEQEL